MNFFAGMEFRDGSADVSLHTLLTIYFFLAWLSACSAPIFASPSTTLERVRMAFGQMASAAFSICFRNYHFDKPDAAHFVAVKHATFWAAAQRIGCDRLSTVRRA